MNNNCINNTFDNIKSKKKSSVYYFLVFVFAIVFVFTTSKKSISKTAPINDPRLSELQQKLDELNKSLAAANVENNKTKKEEEVKPDKKVEQTTKEKNNEKKNKQIKTTPNKKETVTNKSKSSDKKYAAEKKKADWIIKTIENGIHKDRKQAINHILSIKNEGIKAELGEKLVELIETEADLEVKIKAITVSGEIKFKKAVPFLTNSLNNEPDDVIIAAVYAIKRIGDTSAKPALIAKLKNQKLENNSNLTEALIDTLGEFKATELISFAGESIKNTSTSQILRELFVLFLGKVGSKESKPILLELANDEDENEQIRAFAINALGNLKITEAIPDIEKIVKTIDTYSFKKKKKYYNLYIYCISALVRLGDKNAYPLFLNALRSDNAVVRLKAINLIKENKENTDKRTIDILKYKMKYDPSPKVQKAAKDALKELGVDIEADKKKSNNKNS